jgi:hypothetical protein
MAVIHCPKCGELYCLDVRFPHVCTKRRPKK